MDSIYNFSRKDLELKLKEINEKPFRATQIYEWIYKVGLTNFDEMTNISKSSIEILYNIYMIKA